jgi:hypothetical protein
VSGVLAGGRTLPASKSEEDAMNLQIQRRAALATLVLAAAALPAGALGGSSAAGARMANSQEYADPAGDGGCCAPDVVKVAVSNDDAGDVTFRITLANRDAFELDEYVGVVLETDDDESTGQNGWDYVLEYGGGGGGLYAWNGSEWTHVPELTLLSSEFSAASGVVTMTVNQDDLGVDGDLAFYVIAGAEDSDARDDAPDGDLVWEYAVRSPTLYVLSYDKPTKAVAGKPLIVGMTVRGAREESGRIICTARVGKTAVRGRGDWFRFIAIVGNTSRTRVSPRCTWNVPRSARGKTVRGSIALVQQGLQVSRSFALKVR